MLTAALPLGRPLWLREPRCFARIRRRVIAPVACVALGWWLRSQSFPSRHEGQGRNRPTTKASETTQRSPRRRQPSGKAAVSQLCVSHPLDQPSDRSAHDLQRLFLKAKLVAARHRSTQPRKHTRRTRERRHLIANTIPHHAHDEALLPRLGMPSKRPEAKAEALRLAHDVEHTTWMNGGKAKVLRDRRKEVSRRKLSRRPHDPCERRRVVLQACEHRASALKDGLSDTKLSTVAIQLKAARRHLQLIGRDADVAMRARCIGQLG